MSKKKVDYKEIGKNAYYDIKKYLNGTFMSKEEFFDVLEDISSYEKRCIMYELSKIGYIRLKSKTMLSSDELEEFNNRGLTPTSKVIVFMV